MGRRVACGCDDGRILVFEADGMPTPLVLAGHVGRVTALAAAADGSLVSGGLDGTIRRWDSTTGREVGRLDGGVTSNANVAEAMKASTSFGFAASARLLAVASSALFSSSARLSESAAALACSAARPAAARARAASSAAAESLCRAASSVARAAVSSRSFSAAASSCRAFSSVAAKPSRRAAALTAASGFRS
ncbi:MAG: WD40 repeat domain-containing protein [Planctomycetia bacterium]